MSTSSIPVRPEDVPLRRHRFIWILAAVTYGLVIGVGVLSVWAYRHYYPDAIAAERALLEKSESITVGAVWMPMYPGALLQDMTSSRHGDVTDGVLRFTCPDSPEKLITFFRDRLRHAGYNVTVAEGTLQAVGRKGKVTSTISMTAKPVPNGSELQVATKAIGAE